MRVSHALTKAPRLEHCGSKLPPDGEAEEDAAAWLCASWMSTTKRGRLRMMICMVELGTQQVNLSFLS